MLIQPRLLGGFVAILLLVLSIVGGWWVISDQMTAPRGEALQLALGSIVTAKSDPERVLVAKAILLNYEEVRTDALHWSGAYWGFTFLAAILSALAGLILKLESFLKNDAVKKDLAAVLSVSAALLITISTSGDFQRKWQANRVASAELERLGYDFLENNGESKIYLTAIGRVLYNRHGAIVGTVPKKEGTSDGSGPK